MLSDKQRIEIVEAYKSGGSIQKIHDTLGYDKRTVRKVLKENNVPTLSNESVADSIIKRMQDNPEMFSKNFEQLSAVLGSSNVVGVLRDPEKYRRVVVEQARTAMVLGLSALIVDGKIGQASASSVAKFLPVLADIASGKYNLGKVGKETIKPEQMIDALYISLKRVKEFNPKLSKDVEGEVERAINLPKSAWKLLGKQNGGKVDSPDTGSYRQ